jgi:hypothetical protein
MISRDGSAAGNDTREWSSMSPTALTPHDDTGRDIDQLSIALVESGWATTHDIIGCSETEVGEVLGLTQFRPPDDYLNFMKKMGRQAGRLFRGKTVFFPKMLESPEVAAEIGNDPQESLALDNRFFFGHHQGYIVYFFQKNCPAVYSYEERQSDTPAHKVSDSFTEWAWRYFRWSLKLDADNRELFESRQRKREAMGLHREEYHE